MAKYNGKNDTTQTSKKKKEIINNNVGDLRTCNIYSNSRHIERYIHLYQYINPTTQKYKIK